MRRSQRTITFNAYVIDAADVMIEFT